MSSVVDQTLAILQDDWVIYALPFFLIALAIEWTVAWRKALPLYERQDFLASMGVMGLTVVIDVVPKLLGIMLMFLVLFRSIKISIIAILPNFLAAGIVLGGMGIMSIPLDMMTITIAAITVGIGVDHAIHYLSRFRKEFAVDQNYLASMHRAHASIGQALFYTAITIIVGFSILALSNFIPSVYFGLLTGLAMLAALLGSMTLLPKLILLTEPFGNQSEIAPLQRS